MIFQDLKTKRRLNRIHEKNFDQTSHKLVNIIKPEDKILTQRLSN